MNENSLKNLRPFTPGNGGRPKGSRNKLSEDFLADLHAAWKANGAEVIATVIADRPADFLRVVAGIIPKEVKIDRSAIDDLGDDELASYLAIARTAFEAHRSIGTGEREAGGGKQTADLRALQ